MNTMSFVWASFCLFFSFSVKKIQKVYKREDTVFDQSERNSNKIIRMRLWNVYHKIVFHYFYFAWLPFSLATMRFYSGCFFFSCSLIFGSFVVICFRFDLIWMMVYFLLQFPKYHSINFDRLFCGEAVMLFCSRDNDSLTIIVKQKTIKPNWKSLINNLAD